jgi:ribosome biogenesis GTPase A
MKKTRNIKPTVPELLDNVIKSSDIVLCVLDARFINETRNLYLESMIKTQNKKIIYIFNKADLAPRIEKKYLDELSPNVIVSCRTRKGASDLRQGIRIIAGRLNKTPVYIGVIGYPNTGKSSVINLIIGRKEVAKTSAVSGYTRGIQSLKLREGVYLLDSPGIIPQTEMNKEAIKLAKIGVITFDMTKDPSLVVYELMKEHPGLFEKFYGIDAKGDLEMLLEELGRKNGMLLKKGEINVEQAARMILKDWQKGNIKA